MTRRGTSAGTKRLRCVAQHSMGVCALLRPVARLGLAACAFLFAYILAIGALTYVNVVVFKVADVKFLTNPFRAWLEIYWPIWTVFYAPAAVAALLAAWFSGLQGRALSLLLGSFLTLICIVMGPAHFFDVGGRTLLIGLFLLAIIYVAIAQMCRSWRVRN
jgi:hypothetical protein